MIYSKTSKSTPPGTLILLLTAVLLWFFACDQLDESGDDQVPVILLSLDGFRWDYVSRTETPNFDYLIERGVVAESLIPVFPTFTFPNHLSIITGLYPENHGIISNTMYDSTFGAWYWIGEGSAAVTESRWYEGEPFWVTAEKQGLITATYFWPGSEAVINGKQPTYWYPYTGSVTNEAIIDQILHWLDLPKAQRPVFITGYLNDANYWGHRLGPEASAMDTIIQGLDADIGRLISGLTERELLGKVNIIITADHGMTSISRDRMIFLDDYISLSDISVVNWSPVTAIVPNPGMEDSIYNALKGANPHFSIYRKSETPDHWHYRNHSRITPLIGIADEGWSVSTRSYFDTHPEAYIGGTHGYDPQVKTMQGTFIAFGPGFKSGLKVSSFQNIHLYELFSALLNVEPSPNDGDLDSVRDFLKP
jgi:predicted AlkP superfamily pyrophosphatase or phosphodiesterase